MSTNPLGEIMGEPMGSRLTKCMCNLTINKNKNY